MLYKYPRSLWLTMLFLLQTSFKTSHWEITSPLFKLNNTSDSGLANFSWNSTPPNIQGTQTSYPLNSQKKFEEQNYTKPLLLPTITTGIWHTLIRFQLWLNTFNSYTPLYSKMNCLSGPVYEEINPFRNQLLASKRFSNLNLSHLDSQPT